MMPRYLVVASAAMAALILCGCSTKLQVKRHFDQSTLPTAGAPYVLPFTQYEVAVTRRLASCVDDNNQPDLKIGLSVEIKSVQAHDPMRTYVIDLESLDSFFKTTSATVEYYDSGAIKSLNASAEDMTGELVAGVAGTFSKLVTGAVVGPLALAPDHGCSETTMANLKKLDTLQSEIEEHTAKIEQLTAELTKLNALLPNNVRERGITAAKLKQLRDEMTKLATAIKENEPLLKLISESHKVKWPDNGETFATSTPAVPNLSQQLYDSWLIGRKETSSDTAKFTQLALDSAIQLKLKATDPFGRIAPCDKGGKDCKDDHADGFKYRIPARGRLLVCSTPACDGETLHKAGDIGMVSQLGHVYVLPLKSAMFSSKSVSATFSESGMPTSIGLKSAAAASGKASSTMATVGDLVVGVHKTRSEQALNDLKAQTDLLKAKKDFADASKALNPASGQAKDDATNAFKVDTDLINANLAYINAQKALDDAKKVLAAATP